MKLQVPNFKQHGCARRLVLDVWMFSGAWSLEFFLSLALGCLPLAF
jgi:hypothetical protein